MFWNKKKRIFLDYASITPIAPPVREAMRKVEEDFFANPSALYTEALASRKEVSLARKKIADILHVQKDEIIFTGSGTEANNIALLGVFEACKEPGFSPHIITTQIEHPAILEVCKEIEMRGGEVTYLPVSEEGIVSPKDVQDAIRKNTVLISIMYANNEIGTIQPLKEIMKGVKSFRDTHGSAFPYVHTDACQASLYLSLDASKLGVDMMTLDGLKMYGPRGMGALYARGGVRISPIVFGGGQEKGIRSGTENISGIVGLAQALILTEEKKESESKRLEQIRDAWIKKLEAAFPTMLLNGSRTNRLPNNINVCFPGADAEFLVISLDVAGVAASYSSSCRMLSENSSSYVISALGREACAPSSLRLTLGRDTREGDIDVVIQTLKKVVKNM